MKNPIQNLLDSKGISPAELAFITRSDVNLVYEYRSGRPRRPGKRFLAALAHLNIDPEDFSREYQEFREAKAQEALQAIACKEESRNDTEFALRKIDR